MRFLLLFLTLIQGLYAQVDWLTLHGYLDAENVAAAIVKVDAADKELVVSINSSTGEISEVLELARKLYEHKRQYGSKITVYINRQAIGPAAILPFLADDLYTSFFVAWGDIPLGSEGKVSKNLLRSQVKSLIPDQSENSEILKTLVDGMVDDSMFVIEDNGWKAVRTNPGAKEEISPSGETLILNQAKIKELGIAHRPVPLNEFEKRYGYMPKTVERRPAEKNEEIKLLEKVVPQEGINRIGYIAIDDKEQISTPTWLRIKNALEYYKKSKPLFIILELNTPGGEVFAAQKISDALKEMDIQYGIPVVTFINNWAISAGAMIAYSTRYIAPVKDASMGAAEPVLSGEGGQMKAASEKVNSALRTDFASRATFFNRNPFIAEAMVDKDIILVWRNGHILKLDNEEQIKRGGSNPDEIISAKGKLLTLGTKQMEKYGVSNYTLQPASLPLITAKEREAGSWPAEKMLLFTVEPFTEIPDAVIDEYQMDWKTQLFVWLTQPMVASLLFMGMLMGAYIEFNTPGFGLPGSVAALCLMLILLSSFALEIANILEVLLLIVGTGMLAVELFLLPSFGLIGFFGILFLLVGFFGLMLPELNTFEFGQDPAVYRAATDMILYRLAWFSGSIIISVILMVLLAKYVLPKAAPFTKLVLSGGEQTGYISGSDPKSLPPVGSEGRALTPLRPSGKILLEESIYDAVSRSAYIEKGDPIVVAKHLGSVLVVKRKEGA